ncbi:lytic transglycosylase domain-containing protein [Streptomyces sp. NPDC001530]|uniref:lytic transglycosylase domain-containing protein n=1 Tax=Streptomyces sp. NPDC001530 TaxID=3364582 RepID=UPI00369C8670
MSSAMGGGGGGESGISTALKALIGAGTGCGCLLAGVLTLPIVIVVVIIYGGFGVLLAPLIALYLLFHGGSGDPPSQDDANQTLQIFQGDGKGELDTSTVPEDLADPIQKAGALCDAIGPIVIASQIEKESGFNADLVGPNGEQGLSQLPPDIFKQYGKDDDDNGKVSALDAKDSIMAQGRYLCDLADQGQKLLDSGEVRETDDDDGTTNSVLDLALAGYDVGMDAVRAAKGVPQTNEAQGYVLAIRAQFAKYQGIGAPPSGATPGVTPSPTDSPSVTASPTA